MDMSLDEIIRNKNKGANRLKPKKVISRKAPTIRSPIIAKQVTDARLKIIQKNRLKIRDARDKLAEITRANGDARKRLLQKQMITEAINEKSKPGAPYRNGQAKLRIVPKQRAISSGLRSKSAIYRNPHPHHIVTHAHAPLPDVVRVPRGYVDYDNMERMEEEEYSTRLSRTVKNDIAYGAGSGSVPHSENLTPMPPAPRRLNSWGSNSEHFDPFDVYTVPRSRTERHLSPSLELPPPPPKGILRTTGTSGSGSNLRRSSPTEQLYQRRYIPEPTSHLSYEMRSRLEHAPDPHASMGIFSNPLKTHNPSTQSSGGYRIVVSNLHPSVTPSDIKELFEDIGELYDSHIVRPGIAEVIYKSLKDAENAVETYHNRQLDGQPMKCLLVNPRSSNKPTAPAIKTTSSSSRYNSGKTPLEVDIDALHAVLFRR